MGAKEVKAARAALAATVANEVTLNGGKPLGEDNPAYQAANKKLNDAIEESDKAVCWWNGGS